MQQTVPGMQSCAGIRHAVTDGSAKSVLSGSPVEVAGKPVLPRKTEGANYAFFVSLFIQQSGNRSDKNIPYGYAGPMQLHLAKKFMSITMVIPRWNRF